MKRLVMLLVVVVVLGGCGKRSQEGGGPTGSGGDSLTIVSYDPPLPATLKLDQKLMVTVDYTISSVGRARIWVRPYTKGAKTPGYGAHGSPTYRKGRGRLVGWFTLTRPGTVDEVRVEMEAGGAKIVTSATQQIQARWGEEK